MRYALLLAAALGLILCGCRRSEQPKPIPKETGTATLATESRTSAGKDIPADESVPIGEKVPIGENFPVSEDAPLMAQAETREEAEKVAELYGMELASWYEGLATYRTEEDPWNVIQRGREKGWPELSMNYEMKLY